MSGASQSNTPHPATAADIPVIAQVARAAYVPYVRRIGRPPAPMLADFAAHVRRSEVWVLGAPVQGYIVSFPEGSAWQVENIAVAPGAQGQGLGYALMVFAEMQARKAGLARLTLYTNAKMHENITFYQRLGLRIIDRRHADGFDRLFFEKSLT